MTTQHNTLATRTSAVAAGMLTQGAALASTDASGVVARRSYETHPPTVFPTR